MRKRFPSQEHLKRFSILDLATIASPESEARRQEYGNDLLQQLGQSYHLDISQLLNK